MLSITKTAGADVPIFAGLTDKEKQILIEAGHTRKLSRGEKLFLHGDPVKHFYLILKGSMQLVRSTPAGNEKTVALLKSGQTLSEDEIMDACSTHRVSAIAVDEVSLLEFSASWLKEAARKHTALALNLLSLLASRTYLAELEAEQQASMGAPQLVSCFLQRLCILHNLNPRNFELPYGKALIASRLGMEAETFSRALKKLKENGIHVEGNRVTISDLEKIQDHVCSVCSVAGECQTHQSLTQKMGRDGAL